MLINQDIRLNIIIFKYCSIILCVMCIVYGIPQTYNRSKNNKLSFLLKLLAGRHLSINFKCPMRFTAGNLLMIAKKINIDALLKNLKRIITNNSIIGMYSNRYTDKMI